MIKCKCLNSIKVKFRLAVLILLIVFYLSSLYLWYSRTYDTAVKSATFYMDDIVRISNKNFEQVLRESQGVNILASYNKDILHFLSLDNSVPNQELLESRRAVENLLEGYYLGYKTYYRDIIVSTFDGNYAIYGNYSLPNEIKDQPWFDKIQQSNGDTIFIPPHNDLENRSTLNNPYADKVLSVARKISIDSQDLGFIITNLWVPVLIEKFDSILQGNGSIMIIEKKTKEIIFKPNPSFLSEKAIELKLDNIIPEMSSAKGNFFTRIDGKDYLLVYSTSTFTKWTTIGFIPKDNLLKDFRETLKITIILSLLLILAAFVIATLISGKLTQNIRKLHQAISDPRADILEISVDMNTKDEIGLFYLEFKRLLEKIKELVQDIKEKDRQKRMAEIQLLQAQIKPHFIYNTLNTIKFLANLQEAKNIAEVSESLSKLLHISMNKNTEFISIKDENEYIESYLNIQKYQYVNKFNYQCEIEDGLAEHMILKLLIQPIIENAIRHGIVPKKGQGQIVVRVFRDNDSLSIRVKDDGVGIAKKVLPMLLARKVKDDGHIGLINVDERIKMYFGEKYGLCVYSEEGLFTEVHINVPLILPAGVKDYV